MSKNNNKSNYKIKGRHPISGSLVFWLYKRMFDICASLILLPVLVLTFFFLLFFNIYFNPGPIFFTQKRMGKDCKPFCAFKFRSMLVTNQIDREHDEPVEYDRITPLGKLLRQTRLDEIPQIINVLRGEMSLIGPRPDYYDHALIFSKNIKGYRERHIIRPGISGLAQIRLGYAEGMRATKSKTTVDIFYIENAGFWLDFKIMAGTVLTVFKKKGI